MRVRYLVLGIAVLLLLSGAEGCAPSGGGGGNSGLKQYSMTARALTSDNKAAVGRTIECVITALSEDEKVVRIVDTVTGRVLNPLTVETVTGRRGIARFKFAASKGVATLKVVCTAFARPGDGLLCEWLQGERRAPSVYEQNTTDAYRKGGRLVTTCEATINVS